MHFGGIVMAALLLLCVMPTALGQDSPGACGASGGHVPGRGAVGSCKMLEHEVTVIAGQDQHHRCDATHKQVMLIVGSNNEVAC